MPIEEILIRGNSDGTIRGAHAKDYQAVGVDGNGDTVYVPGPARPLVVADLSAYLPTELADALSQLSDVEFRHAQEIQAKDAEIRAANAARDAAIADRDTKVAEEVAKRAPVEADRDALREQVRILKGIPRFKARELARQFNEADMAIIAPALAADPELILLYTKLQQRLDNEPIPLDSETFQMGLAGLKQLLGEDRVREIFTAVNIDIDTEQYITV